jgi:hypothetical protein
MVAGRIVKLDTRLATTRRWHCTTLAGEFGVADADEDGLCAAMDWLLQRQDTIEQKIASRLLAEIALALQYDLACPSAAWSSKGTCSSACSTNATSPRSPRRSRRQDAISAQAALDGLYVIRTSLDAQRMEAFQCVRNHKALADVERAFRSLIETTRIFLCSEIARDGLGHDRVDHFAATREREWRQWQDAVKDWELKRYFEII